MNWRSKWLANVISPSLLQPPVFRAEQRSISIWTQEKWQVAGFSFGCNVDIGLRNLVCLTFHARPSHRLAIVRAAENHFRAMNDNHDIANWRILITPDLDFRRSIFAGHRNIFLCSKQSLFSLRLQPQLYCFSPGGACSGKDSVCVAGVAPLSPDATQSPAHSLVPFTVPTSLQPIGSFGFIRTSGLLPTFGSLSLAKAFAEKQIATRMTRALIVISPSPSLVGKSRMTQAY